MKKITILALFLIPITAIAQNNPVNGIIAESQQPIFINQILIDSIKVKYADVIITNQFGLITAALRYGQNRGRNSSLIRNKDSDVLYFDGLAEVLNLLDFHGWEFVQEIEGLKLDNQINILVKRKTNR